MFLALFHCICIISLLSLGFVQAQPESSSFPTTKNAKHIDLKSRLFFYLCLLVDYISIAFVFFQSLLPFAYHMSSLMWFVFFEAFRCVYNMMIFKRF